MKILFLTDNFPPESNAPATRTYEHCVEWVRAGAEVTVVTCTPNYPQGKVFPGYKNKLYQTEMIDGIKVVRVWSYITPNRGMVKRILDYVSFALSAIIASFYIKTDIIVATSPQLFTAMAGYVSSVFKRRPWIMEIRDLWPESIKAVEAMRDNKGLKVLDRLVLFLYRNADRLVVVTESFKERIHACGVDLDKIHVIKNGVHLHKFQYTGKDQALLNELSLQNKFVVAYIGTHGMAHKLDFIADCAKKVTNPDIHFIFLGEGAYKERLRKQVERLGVRNITLLDAVLKSEVNRYISISDVALVTLKKSDTFKKVIPSKIFENAAMQKPILLGVAGEAAQIVNFYKAGCCFEPENEEDFLTQLQLMYKDKEAYTEYQKGCLELAYAFDRKVLADRMYRVIHGTVYAKAPGQKKAIAIKKIQSDRNKRKRM